MGILEKECWSFKIVIEFMRSLLPAYYQVRNCNRKIIVNWSWFVTATEPITMPKSDVGDLR